MIRRHSKKLIALAALIATPILAHVVIGLTTGISAPATPLPVIPAKASTDDAGAPIVRTARGWTAMRGNVRLVLLAGSPEEIGAQHAALLYDRMAVDERVLWDGFEQMVPLSPLRALMFDIGRVKYRNVDANFPEPRRREIAAEANAFKPDPYEGHMPTYHRMVMLHALYDIALSFEHSPLLGGCTAFGLGPEMTASGHALFARAFDFEAADVFDRDKAVFLVHEDGKIPFASVAWPGFIGVVTGMNAEGVAVAVHGGRAREPSTTGVPVAFSLRETLSSARTTKEAVAILSAQDVMVSHLVFVGDAQGHFAIVERAPGSPAHVRSAEGSPGRASVTNHFEGPLKDDPRDLEVRKTTSTLERRARIDELLAAVPPKSATVETMLEMVRDHRCATSVGASCSVGDRRTIDAFIATHGVVADLTARELWVSEGPRLSGRFLKIDPRLLATSSIDEVASDAGAGMRHPTNGGALPDPPAEVVTLPADPALTDGRYDEGRARAGGPLLRPSSAEDVSAKPSSSLHAVQNGRSTP